jgi:hypothetical protein
VLVDVDEGNNEGMCDDVLDMEKIITPGGNPYKISDSYPIQGINVNPQSRMIHTPHGHEYLPPHFWNQLPYDITTG